MARTRALSSIVAQTAPPAAEDVEERPEAVSPSAPAPEPEVPAQEHSAPEPVDRARKVRSTLDLPAEEHAALQRWATDASLTLGRPVRGQHVLRALVAQLLTDSDAGPGDLRAAVVDRLRNA